MQVRTRWMGVLLTAAALAGCGKKEPAHVAPPVAAPAPPPPVAPAPPPPTVKKSGEVAEILRDLAQWDAATTEARTAAAENVQPLLHKFALLRLETFSAGGRTHEVAIYGHETTGLEFSLIPGGTFEIGSPTSEEGRSQDETPQRVTLTKPFLIARTECTQAAWDLVMGSNESKNKGPTLPLESTSCYDVETFCAKAKVALPTEAQWEFACRAGTTTRYTSGDEPGPLAEYAWIDAAKGSTHPVAGKKPNAFGLFDVHGNVWEWCSDNYGPREGGDARDPVRDEGGSSQHVVRGGAYSTLPPAARSAFRFRLHPGERQAGLGFRPARLVEWGRRR